MFRRTISASIAMVIASIGLAVVAAPAAQASTFRGPVAIGCTSATANNVFTFTRDNTGAGIEQIQIIVRDGRGLILVDTRTSGVVGSQRVLGTYRYTILPSLNPITYTVYSSGGNGLPTVQDYSASVNCNLFESTFVRAAYVDFLGRDPSPQELFNESAALQAGTITRASLVTRLANSDTYIGRIVDKLYVDTLGRRGDSAGVAYWVRRIQSGQVSIAKATASFYASNEYFRGLGGGTTESWVQDMYRKLLFRSPEAGGLDYWVSVAQRSRTLVSFNFFQSVESRRVRVTRVVQAFLGRSPLESGLNYWVGEFATRDEIDLAIDLASGLEYAYRADLRY